MSPLFTAVGKYGAATAIAIYLVWMLANKLPVIEAQHTMMDAEITAMAAKVETVVQTSEKRDLRQLQMLRAICLILAANQKEINLCNPADPTLSP